MGLIVIIFILTKPHLLARDDDDDDDKSKVHAKRPLVITGVEPDIEERLILITGRNFSLGNQFKGKIRLFFPPEAGSFTLEVLRFDHTNPQMLIAMLPLRYHTGDLCSDDGKA